MSRSRLTYARVCVEIGVDSLDGIGARESIVVWIPQCSYTQGAVSEAFLDLR